MCAALLPIFAGARGLGDAADALQVGGHVPLLDAVPLVAGFVVVETPLSVELVVDVVAGWARVNEISLALARRRRTDQANLVLGPFEVEDVAGHGAVELAPRRAVRSLPLAGDAGTRFDQ